MFGLDDQTGLYFGNNAERRNVGFQKPYVAVGCRDNDRLVEDVYYSAGNAVMSLSPPDRASDYKPRTVDVRQAFGSAEGPNMAHDTLDRLPKIDNALLQFVFLPIAALALGWACSHNSVNSPATLAASRLAAI